MPKRKIKKTGKANPKQPAIFRQERRNGKDTAFTVIDGRRIHLGIYGTPEAEKALLIFSATSRRRMEYRHHRTEANQHRCYHRRIGIAVSQRTKGKSNSDPMGQRTPNLYRTRFTLRRHRRCNIRHKLPPSSAERIHSKAVRPA